MLTAKMSATCTVCTCNRFFQAEYRNGAS